MSLTSCLPDGQGGTIHVFGPTSERCLCGARTQLIGKRDEASMEPAASVKSAAQEQHTPSSPPRVQTEPQPAVAEAREAVCETWELGPCWTRAERDQRLDRYADAIRAESFQERDEAAQVIQRYVAAGNEAVTAMRGLEAQIASLTSERDAAQHEIEAFMDRLNALLARAESAEGERDTLRRQLQEQKGDSAALLPVDASASPASTEALTNKEGGCSEAALQPSESAPLASESARSIPDEYREGFQNGMKHIASVVADLSDAVKWANENGGASNWPCSMCGFDHSAIIDLSYEWDCERREKQALFDLAEYRDALAGLLESIGTERAPRAMARARYVLEKFGSGNEATPKHSDATRRSAALSINASDSVPCDTLRRELELLKPSFIAPDGSIPKS